MSYIYIGLGGIFGAISRYALGKFISKNWKGSFPIGTFIINLTGAFLLGFLITIFNKYLPMYVNIKLMITTGFLGAYTTFSTLTYESIRLIEDGEYNQVIKYVSFSVLFGILLSYTAILLGEYI